MRINKDVLLRITDDNAEKMIISRYLDLTEQVFSDVLPKLGPFLNLREQELCQTVIRQIDGVQLRLEGGYRGSERKRGIVMPDFYGSDPVDSKLAVLLIQGKFGPDVSHRDFLGSLIATGIDRVKIGDILLVDGGAQAIVDEDVKSFLIQNLTRVGQHTVDVSLIDLEQIVSGEEKIKEIKTTVSSLRLDSVAASGFGMSRTAMAREIRAGRVKLNWQEVDTPANEVELGDIVSIRGRGRVEVYQTGGTTRKGRIHLTLRRFL